MPYVPWGVDREDHAMKTKSKSVHDPSRLLIYRCPHCGNSEIAILGRRDGCPQEEVIDYTCEKCLGEQIKRAVAASRGFVVKSRVEPENRVFGKSEAPNSP